MAEEFGTSRSKPSRLWYLLPIFFGIVGGIATYLLVQDKDKKFARKLLIVGIILTVVYIVVPLSIGLISLQYFWGIPLAQKQQAVQSVQTFTNTINQLNDNILSAIATGNAQSMNIPNGAVWVINTSDNSISAMLSSKVSNVAMNVGWIQINQTSSTVVYVRSDSSGNGFAIQYKIQLSSPWNIVTTGKSTSDNVKQINFTKNGNSIQIQLIE